MSQHRKDKNEDEIVEQLVNKYHLGVWRSSHVGGGFVDIVVFYNNRNWFIEIKFDKTSKLTPAQKKFHEYVKKHGGQVDVCLTVEQVLRLIGYDALIKTP